MLSLNKSGLNPLTNDQIARVAPAAFGVAPSEKLSARYSMLRTADVVDALRGAGWLPVFAGQGKARNGSNTLETQRHVIRFRHGDATLKAGDGVPELVLLNSHDGTSAYQLHAGLFRFVCGNGLVAADATFAKMSIRHSNVAIGEVVDASFSVIREVPKLAESVEAMRAVTLTREEQEAFAGAAALVRWDEGEAPVESKRLLAPKRREDTAPDLFTTLNVVQENMVRGGVRGWNANGKRQSVRGLASVTENTRVNKALWQLAEEMKRIKAA